MKKIYIVSMTKDEQVKITTTNKWKWYKAFKKEVETSVCCFCYTIEETARAYAQMKEEIEEKKAKENKAD